MPVYDYLRDRRRPDATSEDGRPRRQGTWSSSTSTSARLPGRTDASLAWRSAIANGNPITPSFETLRHKIGAGHRPRAHGARIQGHGQGTFVGEAINPFVTACVFPAARATSS